MCHFFSETGHFDLMKLYNITVEPCKLLKLFRVINLDVLVVIKKVYSHVKPLFFLQQCSSTGAPQNV